MISSFAAQPDATMPLRPRRTATGLLAVGLVVFASWPVLAQVPAPSTAVLTITGAIGERNRGQAAVLDLAALRALPQVSFTTATPWDKQPIKFTGPLLRDVLALVKARGQTLKAWAINDYRIDIPLSDAQRYDVVLAHSINDQPLTVRTRGPLFVVYPFHRHPELHHSTYYERSIWQLQRIDVE